MKNEIIALVLAGILGLSGCGVGNNPTEENWLKIILTSIWIILIRVEQSLLLLI